MGSVKCEAPKLIPERKREVQMEISWVVWRRVVDEYIMYFVDTLHKLGILVMFLEYGFRVKPRGRQVWNLCWR